MAGEVERGGGKGPFRSMCPMEEDDLLLTLEVQSSPLGLEHGGNLMVTAEMVCKARVSVVPAFPSPSSLLCSGY